MEINVSGLQYLGVMRNDLLMKFQISSAFHMHCGKACDLPFARNQWSKTGGYGWDKHVLKHDEV